MKDYEKAVEEFEAADKKYREMQEYVMGGEALVSIASHSLNPDVIKREWTGLMAELQRVLEDRNIKLKNAADLLRQAVVLTTTQWRGPDGKATTLKAGPFSVSSTTGRGFDAKSLLDLAAKHGLQERLLELTSLDKDGKPYHLVEMKYEIDYQGVLAWLRANELNDIVDGAYDEKEKTPSVKGPKVLAFLGEPKDK